MSLLILREDIERRERESLSPFAALAAESRGRKTPEEKCPLRTDFQRDRDRIVHSKSFRRLMHKTQVFLAPEGDHYRTRLTHTLEVAQIGRTISRCLGLNDDLTEAIALGHDLGHTPFGHSGESILDQCHSGGFRHNVQSLRVVDYLERRAGGKLMNLTEEVRDGILNHTGDTIPFTLEGQAIRFSDRIAYINHDIDDAIRGGIILQSDIPSDCAEFLGPDHGSRIHTLVMDLVKNSQGQDKLRMSDECLFYMNKLRAFMFERVYYNTNVKKVEDLEEIGTMIHFLYDFYKENPDQLPEEFRIMIPEWGAEELVKDHIAGMTERYAKTVYARIKNRKNY